MFGLCLARWYKKVREKIPYGVKQSQNYKDAKKQERLSVEASRKLKESRGMLLEGKKNLFMCLRQNSHINWYRAGQILKHLEIHQRAKPEITPALRQKITDIAGFVKKGKLGSSRQYSSGSSIAHAGRGVAVHESEHVTFSNKTFSEDCPTLS
ncbi:conserved Plasmodium protein, unknown function [Plasmodium ovale]|uniref:Uncharacterized protein n=1 Tax=Plasmodium ovale TaxID=36330 RepID=A0A1C3KR73_PLAOA|nr:conserved Plasmodium protein, unknown function [Plasmodium ovale]